MKNKFKEFQRFQDLFIPYEMNVTKKYKSRLMNDAKKWFIEQFGASFGSAHDCSTKHLITWHYSCGHLMFGIPSLGDYSYSFIIKMIHFQYWKTKPFLVGFKYGRFCSKSKMKVRDDNYRDGNPYSFTNFYYNVAWDAGYIIGLSNIHFSKYNSTNK